MTGVVGEFNVTVLSNEDNANVAVDGFNETLIGAIIHALEAHPDVKPFPVKGGAICDCGYGSSRLSSNRGRAGIVWYGESGEEVGGDGPNADEFVNNDLEFVRTNGFPPVGEVGVLDGVDEVTEEEDSDADHGLDVDGEWIGDGAETEHEEEADVAGLNFRSNALIELVALGSPD